MTTSCYDQIQVDTVNNEPSQIIQACGYLEMTVILQLGAAF